MPNSTNRFLAILKAYFWPVCSGLLCAVIVILWLNNFANDTKLPNQATPLSEPAQTIHHTAPYSYSQAVKRAAPAVVNIFTSKTIVRHTHPLYADPFTRKLFGFKNEPQEKVQTGLGSGVIMNEAGYILTNHHVIQGADEILVELKDKRRAKASVVGVDPETDLAVLRVNLHKLPFIASTSSYTPEVGDVTLAIGNPLGVGQTVTMGIISATGRDHLGLNTYENFIQTDAAINRGNSGGALVDAQGKLIGINSAIFSKSGGSDGIGFAIPTSLANQVLVSIIEHGKVIRGWLGSSFQKLTPELANYLNTQNNRGVVIVRVLQNGPAHRAGIMVGDLITQINHREIYDERSALGAIAEISPGGDAMISLIRKGEALKVNAIVGERPSPNALRE